MGFDHKKECANLSEESKQIRATLLSVTENWATFKPLQGGRPFRVRLSELADIRALGSPEAMRLELLRELLKDVTKR